MTAFLFWTEIIEAESHCWQNGQNNPEIHGHNVDHVDHMHQTVDEIVDEQFYFWLFLGDLVLAFVQCWIVVHRIRHKLLLQWWQSNSKSCNKEWEDKAEHKCPYLLGFEPVLIIDSYVLNKNTQISCHWTVMLIPLPTMWSISVFFIISIISYQHITILTKQS